MLKSTAAKILREYENQKNQAEQTAFAHRETLYTKAPGLKELDGSIKLLGIKLARLSANGDGQQVKQCAKEINELRKKRKELLKEHKIKTSDLLPKYKCGHCKDTGYVSASQTAIPSMCKCFRQKLIDAHYSISNLNQVLKEENFDNFDFRLFSETINVDEGMSVHKNMERVYRIATNFAKNFGMSYSNLLLYGETGLGKTFVCHAIAKELLDNGYTVLYMSAQRLVRVIEDARFDRSAREENKELLNMFDQVDLLIIDDLGSEVMTVVTMASLFDIINHRLVTKKSVVISTNLDQKALQEHYSERIVSRFVDAYQIVKFFGENIRTKKKTLGLQGRS